MTVDRRPRSAPWVHPLTLTCLAALWVTTLGHSTLIAAGILGCGFCATALGRSFCAPLDRSAVIALAFVGGLVAKDLGPVFPGVGAAMRSLDPIGVPGPLPWLARNPDLPAAAQQLGGLLFGVGLALALRHAARVDRKAARRVATVVLITLWGFTLVLLAAETVHRPWLEWMPAVASKNAAATLVAVAFVFQLHAVHQGLREAAGFRISLGLAGLLLFGRELMVLNSGTGILAAGAGTALYAVAEAKADRRLRLSIIIWTASVVGLGSTLLVAATPNLAERLFSAGPSFRWAIWQDCLRMLSAAPLFGVGHGAFAAVHPLYSQLRLPPDAFLAHPDSGYVMVLVEWGLVPTLLLGAVVLGRLRRLARCVREPIDHALLAGITALASAALTDPSFFRAPTFFIGCALTGALAGRNPPPVRTESKWSRRRWFPVVGISAAIMVIWGQSQLDSLRWRPLDAGLQAKAGAEGWRRQPGDPIALAHLQAAVELKRWSADFASYAAHQIHPTSPFKAAPFWQLAFARGQEAGGVWLSRAREAFPATPTAYWADLTLSSNPDLALQLTMARPAVARRIATEWPQQRGPTATAKAWRDYIGFCTVTAQADALQAAVPLLPADDLVLQVAAGRALEALGNLAAAWAVLANAFPMPTVPRGHDPTTSLTPQTLIELGQFEELQRLVMQPDFKGPTAIEVLQQIIRRAGASPWFRLRLAHAYAAENRWHEALALLPKQEGLR